MESFASQKLLSLMGPNLLIADLSVCTIGVLLGSSPLCQYIQRYSPFSLLSGSILFSILFYDEVFDPLKLEFCVGG